MRVSYLYGRTVPKEVSTMIWDIPPGIWGVTCTPCTFLEVRKQNSILPVDILGLNSTDWNCLELEDPAVLEVGTWGRPPQGSFATISKELFKKVA